MIKYLYALDCLLDTEKIGSLLKICADEKLIKPIEDRNGFEFLVLDENLEKVKEVLGQYYDKILIQDFIKWIESELLEATYSMEVENAYEDKLILTSQEMFDLISDDLDTYIDDMEKSRIYESDTPRRKLEILLNQLGRNELQNRLDDFKGRLKDPIFI